MRCFLIALVLLSGFAQVTYAEIFQGELSNLRVPLDTPSSTLDAAKESLNSLLSQIQPAPKLAPRSYVTKGGQFVLYGDLFKTGGCFALAEFGNRKTDATSTEYGVIFAEWEKGRWQLRGLWTIPTTWRPKGWQASNDDYLSTTPATEPFILCDLSGDGTPELVIAGEVDKYFQEYYLLRFHPKTHTLRLRDGGMAMPEKVGKYVCLYFKSPRRAIYEEWRFFKWSGDQLLPIASWHDEVGYNQNDPTFSEGERFDRRGQSTVIRVTYGAGLEYEADSYQLTKDEKPFGQMRIKWKDEKSSQDMWDETEKAWFFEKITGLPRTLYPGRKNSDPVARLEKVATISVEGNAEAAKLFSGGTK